MKVQLMRTVDYWVGLPLCILLSLLHLAGRLLRAVAPREKRNLTDIRRIMLVELSEMGSAILAHSAIERLRQGHPEREIYFLIFRRNRESVDLLGIIPSDRVLEIEDSSFLRFAVSAFRQLLNIRRLGMDAVIDLELFSRFTAIYSLLTGAPFLVGFHRYTNEGLYRGNFLTHAVWYNPHQHMALNFLALVHALEPEHQEVPLVKADLRGKVLPLPRLSVSPGEQADILRTFRTVCPSLSERPLLFAFNPHPGDFLPIRGWPLERFQECARTLLTDFPESAIVLLGLESARSFAEQLKAGLPANRVIDLTGRTASLRDALAVLTLCRVLVTNDSGLAHIAALARVPSVTLFGPETPTLYSPLGKECRTVFAGLSCSPCLTAANHRKTPCSNNRCLQAIQVREVVDAVKERMDLFPSESLTGNK